MQLEVRLNDASTVMRSFLGWHDLVVRFPNCKRYGIVGRGSMTVVPRLDYWNNLPTETQDHIFTVGRYCEFAECKIILGGEHQNHKMVNVVFGDMPLFLSYIEKKNGLRMNAIYPGFFEMGNAVVVSHGAIILGGNKIGDGVLVAAGTVVTKSVEPFNIILGAPPVMKKRQIIDEDNPYLQKWWEFSVDDIAHILSNNFEKMNGGRTKIGDEPFIVIQMKEEKSGILQLQEILGFQYHDNFLSFGESPNHIQTYFKQMIKASKGEPVSLDSNILIDFFSER
jgi:carbonic anhydrase/acetyltransferase-like protein (isoleucine patch superfamily)